MGSASAALAGMVALGACQAESPPVVSVGDVAYTSDELVGLTDDRRLLLGELTAFAIAVADSALHEPGAPWIEATVTDLLWERLRAQEALDSAGVGDEVLEARYRMEPDLELTVRHLLVFSARYETEPTRAAARAKAEAALDRIRAGEPFGVVAAEVSEEPGAESREGLLTPGREGSWVDEFWAAATALAPGEVSPVTETQYGFHVLRLEARDTVAFEEARPGVAREVASLMGIRIDGVEGVPLPDPLPLVPDAAAFRASDDETASIAEGSTVAGDWVVRASDLHDAAALLPYAEWRRLDDDPAVRQATFERAIRRAIVRTAARSAGIGLSDGARAAIEREWTARGEQWALQLGMPAGMPPTQIRDAALEALARSGQNASIARNELRSAWGGALHRWSTIEVEETRPASSP